MRHAVEHLPTTSPSTVAPSRPPLADFVGGSVRARAPGLVVRAPVLLVGLALSAVFVATALGALGIAQPITYPEGAHVAAILRVRDSQPLYPDFREFPHLLAPYPPGMYLVGGLLARALDLPIQVATTAVRLFTLLASLAAAGLVYALARATGAGRPAALAGALMLPALPLLDRWGYAARPDLPAVALSLLACLLLLRRPDRPILAAAVAALAFSFKQTAVALPVAAVAWLWWQGRRAEAGRFARAWLGLVLGGLLLLHFLTDGRHGLNVIVAHVNPANGPDVTLRWFAALFERAWLPVLLALAVCAVGLARRRRPGLLELYWGAALALALFTLRGRGSDHNYLIESAAIACALAPRAFDRLWQWSDQRRPAARVGAVLLAAATLVWGWATWTYWDDRGGVQTGRMPLAEIAGATNVLSEDPTPVLLAGRPLAVSDPFHLSMLTSAGRFDPSELANRVKRREFDLVVLLGDVRTTRFFKRQPLWPEEVRLAIKDTYLPTGRVGPYWLYRPER